MATTINLSDPIATWVTKTNTISSDLGTKASLNTTNKTNLVAAINELKTQSDKTDSSTILQLIDANNYLDSSRVDALIPKRGTDFVDSAISNALFDTRLATKTTANLTEGSNLYYTTARADSDAKNAISVTDAGGDGSLSYSAGSGVITYTGPSHAEITNHFVAGAGVAFDSDYQSSGRAQITNTGVTSIVAGTRMSISGGTGAVTITNNISAGTGLSFSGSTLNATGAAAQSSTTSIGAYILGVTSSSGGLGVGATKSGSNVYYAGVEFPYSFTSSGSVTNDGGRFLASPTSVSSGTWRYHGRTNFNPASGHYGWGVWQRIS